MMNLFYNRDVLKYGPPNLYHYNLVMDVQIKCLEITEK